MKIIFSSFFSILVEKLGKNMLSNSRQYFLRDKVYSFETVRQKLPSVAISLIISCKKNQKKHRGFNKVNKGLYGERNRIEPIINRLKQSQRVATRYEKYAHNYINMLIEANLL